MSSSRPNKSKRSYVDPEDDPRGRAIEHRKSVYNKIHTQTQGHRRSTYDKLTAACASNRESLYGSPEFLANQAREDARKQAYQQGTSVYEALGVDEKDVPTSQGKRPDKTRRVERRAQFEGQTNVKTNSSRRLSIASSSSWVTTTTDASLQITTSPSRSSPLSSTLQTSSTARSIPTSGSSRARKNSRTASRSSASTPAQDSPDHLSPKTTPQASRWWSVLFTPLPEPIPPLPETYASPETWSVDDRTIIRWQEKQCAAWLDANWSLWIGLRADALTAAAWARADEGVRRRGEDEVDEAEILDEVMRAAERNRETALAWMTWEMVEGQGVWRFDVKKMIMVDIEREARGRNG